ncbi:hypothetical protein ACFL4T_03870, partial [candidate division KSB1 bacterium]
MNLGESFLVLGALVIFSITTLYLNDVKFDNNNRLMEAEFKTTAIGLAHSYIEEAQALDFDEVVADSSGVSFPNDFTAPGSLGPEGGETYPNFNDIDDFNGFITNITTPRADYDISINVSYADSATLIS